MQSTAQPDLNSALRIPGMLRTGDAEELGEEVTEGDAGSGRRSGRGAESRSASAKARPPPQEMRAALPQYLRRW